MQLCLETLSAVTCGSKIEGSSVGGECSKELDPKHIAQAKKDTPSSCPKKEVFHGN
jgi:hypothetical protein